VVVAATALVGCVGSMFVPRGMQWDRKAALAVPNLVHGVGCRQREAERLASSMEEHHPGPPLCVFALEGKGDFHAETGLGLAIGPFDLADGTYWTR
jgi:hypothetical protein